MILQLIEKHFQETLLPLDAAQLPIFLIHIAQIGERPGAVHCLIALTQVDIRISISIGMAHRFFYIHIEAPGLRHQGLKVIVADHRILIDTDMEQILHAALCFLGSAFGESLLYQHSLFVMLTDLRIRR